METKTGSQTGNAPFDRKAFSALAFQERREKRGNIHVPALCRVLLHKLSHLTDFAQCQRAEAVNKSQLVHLRRE